MPRCPINQTQTSQFNLQTSKSLEIKHSIAYYPHRSQHFKLNHNRPHPLYPQHQLPECATPALVARHATNALPAIAAIALLDTPPQPRLRLSRALPMVLLRRRKQGHSLIHPLIVMQFTKRRAFRARKREECWLRSCSKFRAGTDDLLRLKPC